VLILLDHVASQSKYLLRNEVTTQGLLNPLVTWSLKQFSFIKGDPQKRKKWACPLFTVSLQKGGLKVSFLKKIFFFFYLLFCFSFSSPPSLNNKNSSPTHTG